MVWSLSSTSCVSCTPAKGNKLELRSHILWPARPVQLVSFRGKEEGSKGDEDEGGWSKGNDE